jgi:hypothetical protein
MPQHSSVAIPAIASAMLTLLVSSIPLGAWQTADAQTIVNAPKSAQRPPVIIGSPGFPPGSLMQPGEPAQLGVPAQAGIPAQPGIPTYAGQPAQPGVPGTPGTPGAPGTPGTPGAPMQAPGWLAGVTPDLQVLALRFPVVLYTPENCGEPCDEARFWLLERGIPFLEARVESTADLNAFRRLGFGIGFPALAVGNRRLSGFQEPHWQNALNQAGFPRPSRLPPAWQPPPAYPLSVWARPDSGSRGTARMDPRSDPRFDPRFDPRQDNYLGRRPESPQFPPGTPPFGPPPAAPDRAWSETLQTFSGSPSDPGRSGSGMPTKPSPGSNR